jgi:hypothetical protein
MKKILISVLIVIGFMTTSCGTGSAGSNENSSTTKSDTGKAIISFVEYNHDFGIVTEGEKVSYVFSFENKGTSDLVVSSVSTSCGCTAPRYDTKPIRPGEAGNIEVVYNASGMNGKQTKTITVKSNASVPVVLLRITAEVVEQ